MTVLKRAEDGTPILSTHSIMFLTGGDQEQKHEQAQEQLYP